MPVPNTGGQLRSRIADMEIGDYIVWKSNGSAYIMDGSTEGYTERPVTGASDAAMPYAMTYWYGIKVDQGLIVADRVIHTSISWNQLNSWGLIEGKPLTLLDGTIGIYRSLGGGNAFADADGGRKITDQGFGGWPTNNEWDTYIVKKDYGNGAGRDDVWHYWGVTTWCNETPSNGVAEAANTSRVSRGAWKDGSYTYGNEKTMKNYGSGVSSQYIGFRPVFEYREVTT